MPDPAPRTAFISGPISAAPEYFDTHYKARVLAAIERGDSFVLGPSPGIDRIAFRFLIDQGVPPPKIAIYLTEFQRKTADRGLKWFRNKGGLIRVEGDTMSKRDAAMTRDSDYDILKYMSVEEQRLFYGENYRPRISGTQKNERRRLGLPLHTLD